MEAFYSITSYLRFHMILYSELGNENSDAGHIYMFTRVASTFP